MALPMANQSEMVKELAEETGYSQSDIRHMLTALENFVVQELAACNRVRIGRVVQLEPKLRKATKKRKGRNPQTGEEITIAAKPASVKVGARILTAAKGATPSVQKLRKALG